MSALRIILVLVAGIVLCSAGVAKREAIESYDICAGGSVDLHDGSDFDLTSSNFGYGNYLDYTDCATVLESGEDPLEVAITFNSVDIEQNGQCSWDSLCVNGVKLCGSWAYKKSFRFLLAEFSKFTLRFRTDSSVTRTGFSVNVKALRTTSDNEIFQADSGVGSAANQISYKQVSYSSGYANSYTDKCAGDYNQPNWYNASTPWYNHYTSPSYNGSWNGNNYTSPSYNGSWNGNNYTSPSYNSSWNNRTSPSYNSSWNWNYTSPSYNSSWNNRTSPSYNSSWNWNYTSPSYNSSWNNRTSPSYNSSWNNYTSPYYNSSWNGSNYTSSSNNEARILASTTSWRPNSSTPWPTSTTRQPATSTTRRPATSTTRRPTTAWGR
ncbi:hypothetical protein BsWGS_26184 [Bradybaena similaris]